MRFLVKDTGVGIAPDDQPRSEEFFQVEGHAERGPGTGLGLARAAPAERLAARSGSRARSAKGPPRSKCPSTTRRRELDCSATGAVLAPATRPCSSSRTTARRSSSTKYLTDRASRSCPPGRSTRAAMEHAAGVSLDIMLDGEASWSFLRDLRWTPHARHPTLVVTVTNREDHARALGADEFWLKPIEKGGCSPSSASRAARPVDTVLVIDDDEVSLPARQSLEGTTYRVLEASDGAEASGSPASSRPRSSSSTSSCRTRAPSTSSTTSNAIPSPADPVIIHTSKNLASDERSRLRRGVRHPVEAEPRARSPSPASARRSTPATASGEGARKGDAG